MADEHRQDIKIGAKAVGFGALAQSLKSIEQLTEKITKGQTKGFSEAEKQLTVYTNTISGMESKLGDLAKRQLDTVTAMESVDKGSKAYEGLEKNLKKVNDESHKIKRTMGIITDAFKTHIKTLEDAKRAQGAFSQGLLQGMVPEVANLQRGPGMMRQAAGGYVGRQIRGFGSGAVQRGRQAGGGLAASPFTGSQGVSQALQAIPVAGDFLSGQLQTVMGFAGQALGAERSRLGMSMFMGGGMGQEISQAEKGARARSLRNNPDTRLSPGMKKKWMAAYDKSNTDWRDGGVGMIAGPLQDLAGVTDQRRKEFEQGLDSRGSTNRGKANRAATRAGNRVRGRVINPLRRAGARFLAGGEQEAIQAASGIMQVGGGSIADLQSQGMLDAGLAAQTKYGVGADVSGSFLQAGRRGGLVGGGRADREMTQTIADAMGMGLEGSEINEYLRTVASGISEWKHTGIPFNNDSMAKMGTELAKFGLGGVRGSAISQGLHGAAKRVGMGGAQSGTDMLLMQTLTGYTGQGGAEEYEKSLKDMEEGTFKKGGMQELFSRLMKMGGGNKASGRMLFTDVMRQGFGTQIGRGEVGKISRLLSGDMSKDDTKELNNILQGTFSGKKAAPKDVKDLLGQADSSVGGWASGSKSLANIQNQQIDIGKKMMPTMLNFERQSKAIATSFANFASGPLKEFTKNTASLAEAVKTATTNFSWINTL